MEDRRSTASTHSDTYRDDVQLFIDSDTLLSQEGTTQNKAGLVCWWWHRRWMSHRPQEMVGLHSWERTSLWVPSKPNQNMPVSWGRGCWDGQGSVSRNRHLCHRRWQMKSRSCYWDSGICREVCRAESWRIFARGEQRCGIFRRAFSWFNELNALQASVY